MLAISLETAKQTTTQEVVLSDEIDTLLSDLADMIIDDYLSHDATRCYTEIKSKSESTDEQGDNCNQV